jgi:hypothetical protein
MPGETGKERKSPDKIGRSGKKGEGWTKTEKTGRMESHMAIGPSAKNSRLSSPRRKQRQDTTERKGNPAFAISLCADSEENCTGPVFGQSEEYCMPLQKIDGSRY